MATHLFDPFLQVENSAGVPLSGAKLYFYDTNTTDAITVYQDAAKVTPHANPVVADAAGLFPNIWVEETIYKTILKTSAGVTILSTDPHTNASLPTVTVDNTVPRFDGTTGKLQTSTVTISDLGVLGLPFGGGLSLGGNDVLIIAAGGILDVSGATEIYFNDADVGILGDGASLVFGNNVDKVATISFDYADEILMLEADGGVQLQGTPTNDNAPAGKVGEYIFSEVLVGDAVTLTTTVTANVTSIDLEPGDYDVEGLVAIDNNGTTVTLVQAAVTNTSAALGTTPNKGARLLWTGSSAINTPVIQSTGRRRFELGVPTTLYLPAVATFSGGTSCKVYGFLAARRVR